MIYTVGPIALLCGTRQAGLFFARNTAVGVPGEPPPPLYDADEYDGEA